MTEVVKLRDAPPSTGIRHYTPVTDIEVRQHEEGDTVTFGGYAIVWDSPTLIRDWMGSFTEVFTRGAFAKTIAERGPTGNRQIKLLTQHGLDSYTNAGRFVSLIEDDRGLRFEAETISTNVGRDLSEELRAGVIDTVSIGFDAVREEWNQDEEKRTVLEARLFEISTVNWPAYPDAKIDSVRAFDRLPAYLDALLSEIRAGKVLSNANFSKLTEARDLISEVIDSATPAQDGPDEDPPEEENARDYGIELALRERGLTL